MAHLVIEPCGCAHIAYGNMRTASVSVIKDLARKLVSNLKRDGDISYIEAKELEREISNHKDMYETAQEAKNLSNPIVPVKKSDIDILIITPLGWAHTRPMAQA